MPKPSQNNNSIQDDELSPLFKTAKQDVKPLRARSAQQLRMQYYNRLDASGEDIALRPPPHVLPQQLFTETPIREKLGKTSSFAVIFTICNTMVGSTMLSIPWGLRQAGDLLGTLAVFAVGLISFYTCTLVIRHGHGQIDFSDVCQQHLGRWSQILSLVASCIVLLGAAMAFHVLMRDSLQSLGSTFIPDSASWWSGGQLAALLVACCLFPFLNLRSLTLFMKINSFGLIFVLFISVFMIYAAIRGLVDPDWTLPSDDSSSLSTSEHHNHLHMFSTQFGHLLGMLSLSFFVHNVILQICGTERTQVRNKVDTGIAYSMAAMLYYVPGILCATAFRFAPDTAQNFLNNFPARDVFAAISRASLLLQLMTVYPLVMYMIRVQVCGYVVGKAYPGVVYVTLFNLVTCAATTSIAAFYPNVGTVLRFTGAFCGLVYLFFLPVSVHLSALKEEGSLTVLSVLFHGMLVLFGFAVVCIQFVPDSAW
eukprot:gb/GECH01010381.1/.p1 GENE.gb/GECH01010381.1/~~gb/GECH01010381.1/.p1  ORF type:complete len:480 (+),score=58.23 gb/GECH01010381.1/:1-1440(+)